MMLQGQEPEKSLKSVLLSSNFGVFSLVSHLPIRDPKIVHFGFNFGLISEPKSIENEVRRAVKGPGRCPSGQNAEKPFSGQQKSTPSFFRPPPIFFFVDTNGKT